MIKRTEKEKEKKIPKKFKKLSQTEYEKKVIELAKSGLTSEKIGEQLRQEGSHPREYNKKISKILDEKGQYVNPDLKNVETKLEKIRSHYEKNKQDKRSMRERDRMAAHLRKLKKYHKLIN